MEKKLILAALALTATLFSVAAFAEEPKVATDCGAEERAWVAAHANNLPKTYEAMLPFSLQERKYALAQLDAQSRSNVWRQHMRRYLEVFGGALNPEQQAVIQRGIDLVSPLYFSFKLGDPGREVVEMARDNFKAEAAQVLAEDQIAMIFLQLGSVDDSLGRGPITVPQRFGRPCNCASHGDCYAIGPPCVLGGGQNCRPVLYCGYWADEACWGRCSG